MREALSDPATGRENLLVCLEHDPRVDTLIEDRTPIYTWLSLELGLTADDILAVAAIADEPELVWETLATRAHRGDDASLAPLLRPTGDPEAVRVMLAELRRWPHFVREKVPLEAVATYAEVLGDSEDLVIDVEIHAEFWNEYRGRIATVENAFTDAAAQAAAEALERPSWQGDPESAGTEELLLEARFSESDALERQLTYRTANADLRLLMDYVVRHQDQTAIRVAARVLAKIGEPGLLDVAEQLFAVPDEELGPVDRTRRRALELYVRDLPPEHTLQRARSWFPRGGALREAAFAALSRHAEPRDREWIADYLRKSLPFNSGEDLQNALLALRLLADSSVFDVFELAIEHPTHCSARHLAYSGLLRIEQPQSHAHWEDGLWDSDYLVRRLSVRRLLPYEENPVEVTRRLQEIRDDEFEDVDVCDEFGD